MPWRIRVAFFCCLLLAVLGCGEDRQTNGDPSAVDDDSVASDEGWHWQLHSDGSLDISRDDRLLFTITGVERRLFNPNVGMLFGFYFINPGMVRTETLYLTKAADRVILNAGNQEVGEITFDETAAGNLRVLVSLRKDQAGRAIRLRFALSAEDRFWGFGEQYNFVDFRGQKMPVWVQEQGVGRRPLPLLPTQGDLHDTYFPMPYFLDPAAGKGFLLENTTYSLFDLGSFSSREWSVEAWDGATASFLVLPGPKPAAIVTQLTAEIGRPDRIPPDWAFAGVWLAAQGGTEMVAARLETALEAGIPVSAVWVQDWVGLRNFGLQNFGVKYHWTLDEQLYPNLREWIASLDERGIRFLGYFNPFIVPRYDQYAAAEKRGYLIRRPDGRVYQFPIITFVGSLLDVTNPQAGAWFQDFARRAIDLGMRGWMADFGEWLPYDAVLDNGAAPTTHNLYPTLWHRLNREALEEAYPDGDYVLLTRSGFSGEQRVAQIVWAGDQEASWDPYDGLPTVVTAGLTIGLAGIPFFTHDIAGFSGGPSTQELYLRWTELGAFTPVMRTHEGLQKLENHNFDSDPKTLAHFTRFAKIHAALFPYFAQLANEARAMGLPLIRHTELVDPDWAESLQAHGQWMIGDDLLLAPVVTEGGEQVKVYLPEGEWEHLFTGERYSGRTIFTVPAPIGTPAAFFRRGRLAAEVELIRSLN
ncbi:MAG: alpha-glucosidase [Myxococcales bacterium]|nr:alpha-glucosidase [Myxococcales bacterium]